MSIIANCRDDLVDAIKALPQFAAETVIVGWMPDIDRKELKSRQIYVDPEGRETRMIARGCKQTSVSIIVAIVAPHKQGEESSIAEEEQGLVDAIIDSDTILGKRIGTRARAIVDAIEQPVIAASEHWRKYRQATTLLRVKMIV